MARYQFTIYADKYRPVSTIVEADSKIGFIRKEQPYRKAIQNILKQKHWTVEEMIKLGYKQWKVRRLENEEEVATTV